MPFLALDTKVGYGFMVLGSTLRLTFQVAEDYLMQRTCFTTYVPSLKQVLTLISMESTH